MLCTSLVLHPELRGSATTGCQGRLFPGVLSQNLGEGSFVWVLTGLKQQLRGPTFLRIRMALSMFLAFTKQERLDGLAGATAMTNVWR